MSIEIRNIEHLRNFAMKHNEAQFVHLCTAALSHEGWAMERLDWCRIAILNGVLSFVADGPLVPDDTIDAMILRFIRSIDTARPDGGTAKSLQAP